MNLEAHAAVDAFVAEGGPAAHTGLVSAIRRARSLAATRASRAAVASGAACEFCRTAIIERHRHLLHLDERRILCVCESCWALRSGDPSFRPTGSRVRFLDDFAMPDEVWGAFRIPVGLAFFFLTGPQRRPASFYPSPAGAMESELDLSAWDELTARNPVLAGLEPEAEALIVHRHAAPHRYVIAPLDRCYELVGLVRAAWEGFSGGDGVERAVNGFFGELATREEGR